MANNDIIEDDILYVNGRKGKRVRLEQYQDAIARVFPSVIIPGEKTLSRTVTFQVTDACNLACTYCYQINKGTRKLKFEDAKKLIDMLLDEDERISDYVDPAKSPAIIIEFIGGEPLLEIDLMDQIVDYFKIQAAIRRHPWATRHCISVCSNGVLYFDPRVQNFLNKNKFNISFSITIDGNKELHDSCRVFHDGRPSYDIAVAAAQDWIAKGNYMGSKITIAPENITFLYDAITHMVDLGYDEINANVVYEKGWELEHAKIYYDQLKRIADYWIENGYEDTKYLALFEDNFFRPKHEEDNDNWCFKAGTLILGEGKEVPIEDIKVGDKVIGVDGELHNVSKVMKRISKNTASIEAEGIEKTYTTMDHPYLVRRPTNLTGDVPGYKEPEWIKVSDIKPDDYIMLYQDNATNWVPVSKINTEEPYKVFNITVDDVHSYVANGAVVHNCGGTGYMLAIDPEGRLYPCIRYMESSLGDDVEAYNIGDVENGIGQDEITKERLNCLDCITRKSQSTDECFNCPIADGCSWCFKAGTLITTPHGLKPIEDIVIGDDVITASGNTQPVTNINKRYTDDAVMVNTTGAPDIYTTREHPFLVKPLIKYDSHGLRGIYDDPKWVKAEDIKQSDRIGLLIPVLGNIDMDSGIAYLAGRYVGDGWKVDTTRKTPTYRMCCSYDEAEVLEAHFKAANVTYNKDKSKRTAQEYTIHTTNHNTNSNNETLIRIISDAGKYAHGKRVPTEVFTWSKESVEYFLKGLYDADGYHDVSRNTLRLATSSKELGEDISFLLRAFGKKTNWSIRKHQNNKIQGRGVNLHTAYELTIPLYEPERKWYEIDDVNHVMWVNVRSVEFLQEGYDVYNMTVDKEHTFIADGAIVHNCSAYNYQEFGTPDSRAIYICIMHKTRSLANVYYWNKVYRKKGIDQIFKLWCPDEWALEIISQEELDMLKELSTPNNENTLIINDKQTSYNNGDNNIETD